MAFTISDSEVVPKSDVVPTAWGSKPAGYPDTSNIGKNPQPLTFASNEMGDTPASMNQTELDYAQKHYTNPKQQAILSEVKVDSSKPRFTISGYTVSSPQQPTPVEPQQPQPTPTRDGIDPGSIMGSAGFGSAIGLAAPELVQGAGKAISMIPSPWTKAIGGGLQVAGSAMKGGRLEAGVAGGVGGAASETGGQLYETQFGSGIGAEATRAAAGIVTTEALAGLKTLVKAPVGWLMGHTPGLRTVVAGIKTFANGDLDQSSLNKVSSAAWDAVRKLPVGDTSQTETLNLLKSGIENDRMVAQQHAQQIIKDAEAKVQKLTNESPESANAIMRSAKLESDKILAQAIDRQNKLTLAAKNMEQEAQRITANNVGQLETVGTRLTRTPEGQVERITKSDIGDNLRTPIVKNMEADLKARSEAYKTANDQVSNVVQAKEAAGSLPKDTQAYKDLIGEIKGKLLKTGAARTKGTSDVTDKAAINLYEDVQSAVEGRKIAIRDENGEITGYKSYPSTFEAIDYLRKKWGTAAKFGQNVEGFSAEQKDIATKLYDKLDKIQAEYVGEDLWRGQQSKYAEMTGDIKSKYYTKSGQKITARDEFNQEQFLQDSSKIPEAYFGSLGSRDKVRQLVELTGDRKVVEQEASKYMSMMLEGHNLEQAKKVISSKQELLNEFPELKARVNGYLQHLEGSKSPLDLMAKRNEVIAQAQKVREQAGAASQQAMTEARSRATQSTEQLIKDASRIREDAKGGAKAVMDAHQKVVDSILTSDTPYEVVSKILTQNPTGKLNVVAKLLGNTPKGQAAFADASRQVIANMTPQRLETYWPQVLRGAMKDSGVVGETQLAQLDKDINAAVSAFKGSTKERLDLKKRMLIHGIGLYTSTVGGRFTFGDN